MEQSNQRQSDFITSIILLAFGLFVVIRAFGMPMKAAYGGVQTHWYVAPALFPLIVGAAIILLSAALMGVAIKAGALTALSGSMGTYFSGKISEKNQRVLVIALALLAFIYLFIPFVDFFIAIMTFLFFITTVFYMENEKLMRKLTLYFAIECGLLILMAATGLLNVVNQGYIAVSDVIFLLAFVGMVVYARRLARAEGLELKKVRTVLIVSIVTPLFLCPVFRYFLLVPLPNEGLILSPMNMIYYAIKY